MEGKGITNPDLEEGKKLCLNCPLADCELMPYQAYSRVPKNIIRSRTRRQDARLLKSKGWSIGEIAYTLGISKRTVLRYLR